MSHANHQPWWYSGTDESPGATGSAQEAGSTGLDWWGMLGSAGRLVEWARGAVLDAHGDHADPREHLDCLICRTVVLIGDQIGMDASGARVTPMPTTTEPAEPITWIPRREDGRSHRH